MFDRRWISTFLASSIAILAWGLIAGAPSIAADLNANGTFAFLTESVPIGSTNTEYVTRLRTVNADGPVSFSADMLPLGVSLDAQTGILTGRPTETYNQDVTFSADDGVQVVQIVANVKVNSSGGGGNAGSTFTNSSLLPARVGLAYSETLSVSNGVGPYVFGAAKLPPGLSLDGGTGEISGTPISPGIYYTELSVADFGENNRVVKVLPLTVLPASSDFQFTNVILNNGEVATPFCDFWTTSGAVGTVTFSASGLPPGLAVDPVTGIVDGTPSAAGTYEVILGATDDQDTITMNQPMIIVPAGSNFHWAFSALPTALVDQAYDRQPPILVVATNGATVGYSAIGLPTGLLYDPLTGELTGTATQVGEYPVLFTAVDSTTGESIGLSSAFHVLPPEGGDAVALAANFWVSKFQLTTGTPGKDSWKKPGTRFIKAIYNADRTKGNRFDPATEALVLSIGSRSIQIDPGTMSGKKQNYSYRSDKGDPVVEAVELLGRKQTVKWFTRNDTLTDTTPGLLRHSLVLGGRVYELEEFLDAEGIFRPGLDLRRSAFVVKKGKLAVKGGGKDSATFSLRLADPAFTYEAGVSPLRFRLLNGAEVLIDKDFTLLGTATSAVDARTGVTVYTIESLEDPAADTRLRRFRYLSKRGIMTLSINRLTLPALAPDETNLTAEVTIGDKSYFTTVTFFETDPGEYSTDLP